MTAPNLFEFDFSQPAPVMPLQVGDIVRKAMREEWRHTWRDYAHWQIVAPHPDSTPLDPIWLCRAVPVSDYGGQVAALRSKDLERTGLSWRVPSHAEVEGWMSKHWGINSFNFALNFKPDHTVFIVRGGKTWERGNFEIVRAPDDVPWGAYVEFPPLPEEAELMELMGDLLEAMYK